MTNLEKAEQFIESQERVDFLGKLWIKNFANWLDSQKPEGEKKVDCYHVLRHFCGAPMCTGRCIGECLRCKKDVFVLSMEVVVSDKPSECEHYETCMTEIPCTKCKTPTLPELPEEMEINLQSHTVIDQLVQNQNKLIRYLRANKKI